jgi:uncharacterized membrane protein
MSQTIPPASFTTLVQMLATQALAAMGKVNVPGQDIKPDFNAAKHFIDLITVLEEKSKGNLTDDEQQLLNMAAHELRMAYVLEKK